MNFLVPVNPKKTLDSYFDNQQNQGMISHDDLDSFVYYYMAIGIYCSNGNNLSSIAGVILDLESDKLDNVKDYKRVLIDIAIGRTKVYPISDNDYQNKRVLFRKSTGLIETIKSMKFIYDYAKFRRI